MNYFQLLLLKITNRVESIIIWITFEIFNHFLNLR